MNNIPAAQVSTARSGFELFLVSLLILFLELAGIRWFPAHALHLTFFTNVVLLASFLGMSVGCLAANRRRNYLAWTPVFLIVAMAAAHIVEITSGSFVKWDEGRPSPQVVFFGVATHTPDIFDTKTKKLVATLKDESGKPVSGSKFIEVHFRDGKVVQMGSEFGLGRK